MRLLWVRQQVSMAADKSCLPDKLPDPPGPGKGHVRIQDCICNWEMLSEGCPCVTCHGLGWEDVAVFTVSHVLTAVNLMLFRECDAGLSGLSGVTCHLQERDGH